MNQITEFATYDVDYFEAVRGLKDRLEVRQLNSTRVPQDVGVEDNVALRANTTTEWGSEGEIVDWREGQDFDATTGSRH